MLPPFQFTGTKTRIWYYWLNIKMKQIIINTTRHIRTKTNLTLYMSKFELKIFSKLFKIFVFDKKKKLLTYYIKIVN